MRRTLLAACLLAGVSGAMAGTVAVSFVNAPSYSDAGSSSQDEQANLQAIARHLQGLGQGLPANHVLKVEVLDVDLAGTVRPLQRGGVDLRVIRGGADFPRIELQYTLEVDGKPQRSAREALTDLDYARGLTGARKPEALYYEKRMLDRWFKARFAQPAAAG